MSFTSSLAFFDHLMNEGALDEATLLAFLGRSTSDEGLHLDFKSGQELDKPQNKRNLTVRQYVAAFANSEGGVLIIGVADDKALDPITTSHEGKVGGDLAQWAARCVSELIGYLGVPPRFSTVDVAGGKVLLIAVARAASLVPVIKDGRQAYYFRVEDEAREVYPHLVSDLLLGRRRAPSIEIAVQWRVRSEHFTSRHLGADAPEDRGKDVVVFGGELSLTNNSLVTAADMVAGMVGYTAKTRSEERDPDIPPDLRARVHLIPHPEGTSHPYALNHVRFQFRPAQTSERPRQSITLKPFVSQPADMGFPWKLEERGRKPEFVAVFALYLVPEGCEPLWFEVLLPTYDDNATKLANDVLDVRFVRIVGRRPRVGLLLAREVAV